jgi:hypothetical protein
MRKSMNEKTEFQGGPLSGMTMQGQFWRRALEVEHSPKRYPSRLVAEYDTVPTKDVMGNAPTLAYTEGRDTLVATYEFDEGLGFFEFKGWSVRRIGPSKFDELR